MIYSIIYKFEKSSFLQIFNFRKKAMQVSDNAYFKTGKIFLNQIWKTSGNYCTLEAVKKVIFFVGPATKAYSYSPLKLSGHRI